MADALNAFSTPRDNSLDFTHDGNFISYVNKHGYPGGVTDTSDSQEVLGNTQLLTNGLNVLHAPSGYGKSYTSVIMASKAGVPAIYLDMEGNNQSFVDHCKHHSVEYIFIDVPSFIPMALRDDGGQIMFRKETQYGKKMCKDELDVIETLCVLNKGSLIIVDSFSDIFKGGDQNGPLEVQAFFSHLHMVAKRNNVTLLVLDHSTYNDNSDHSKGFTIEGSKSGKMKKCACMLKLNKDHIVEVMKSRNRDTLPVGSKFAYGSVQPSVTAAKGVL